jgi:arylsulfatase A-like enzyme/Flp pilus assembly protein TadD
LTLGRTGSVPVLLIALVVGAGACRSSPPARLPIVLITIDTLRADHVSDAIAPTLAALGRDAVVFDNAVSVGPVTLPAHASLLTGQFPPAHGVRDNHLFALDASIPTYTSLLASRGYDTAAFVSAVVLDRRHGLNAGFGVYDDVITGESPERPAAETLAAAERWLGSRTTAAATPFFLWIHLFEPHAPYLAGSYAAEVTQVDRELARFFETLRRLGLWNHIVLSVTSDHGESLGEHGEDTHGFFIYDATIRIPWLLKAPTLPGRRFSPQVRLLDIMPTMLKLAGTAAAEAIDLPAVEGRSLAEDIRAGADPGLTAYVETLLPRHQFNWSELAGIRTADLKFISAPEPELYRLGEDPGETRNLAASEADLAARMRRVVAQAAAGRAAARRAPSEMVDAERLLSLGYLGQGSSAAEEPTGSPRPDPKRKLEVYRLVMAALTLSESGRADAALEALAKAERDEPDLTHVHYLKGVILGGQERYREAAGALERTVALNPKHVLARFKLALAYLRLGNHTRAEAVLQAVVADEPRNMRAYQNLAAIAYARGDLARAEQMATRATAIDPAYFDAWNTLGAVYLMTQRPAEAVDALNRAIALRSQSGQAHHNLALAHHARGDARAAAAARYTACKLDSRYCQ